MTVQAPRRSSLTWLVALHVLAALAAVLVLTNLVLGGPLPVRRPDWLAPRERAVVAALAVVAGYCGTAWLLATHRRAGLAAAAVIAAGGIALGAAGVLQGGLVFNVVVLALVAHAARRGVTER